MARSQVDMSRLQDITKDMLLTLGCNLEDENLADSPRRIAESLVELTTGLDEKELDKMRTIFKKSCSKAGKGCDNMIVLGGSFHSLCAHHFLPFRGRFMFAYIPNKHIIGASKVQRIMDFHAAKPQGQESLAHDVLDTFDDIVNPKGSAMWCAGTHDCMTLRGVQACGSWMENRHFRGEFLECDSLRSQFALLISRGRPDMS